MSSVAWGFAGAGVVILALLGALWFAYRGGKQVEEGEQAKAGVDNARKAIKIDSGVHRLDDDERKRLLNRRD